MTRYSPGPRRSSPRLPLPPAECAPNTPAASARRAATPGASPATSAADPPPAAGAANAGGGRPGGMEFVRVTEVARLLDISTKRVYQLVRTGDLEAMRLGPRQMRISRRTLHAYIGRLLAEEADREEDALAAEGRGKAARKRGKRMT